MIWGHEALIRGPGDSVFANLPDLFELARAERGEGSIEERCRSLAFEAAGRDPTYPGMLFVNANPLLDNPEALQPRVALGALVARVSVAQEASPDQQLLRGYRRRCSACRGKALDLNR